jgi:hypothetical protein
VTEAQPEAARIKRPIERACLELQRMEMIILHVGKAPTFMNKLE